MSTLQPKISIEEQESSFLVYDCTGNYTGDNKGGYGGINPRMGRVTENVLEIEPPNSKMPYPINLNVVDYLPNKDGLPMEVYPLQLGQKGTRMESGKYKFKLSMTVELPSGLTETKTAYAVEVFVKDITCCVDEHSDCLDKNVGKDIKQQKIIELSNLLDGVNYLIANGNYDKAEETIEYMKSQCKCQNC